MVCTTVSKIKKLPMGIKKKRRIKTTLLYVFLSLLSLVFLFPFFVILTRSFMSDGEIMLLPPRIFPDRLSLDGYKKVLSSSMLIWLKNTVVIMVFNMIGNPLSSSLCAYGFAKIKFRGRGVCFMIVLSTIMLPGIAIQIPSYIIYNKLHWINTSLPLIVPAFFGGGAMGIFLFRQFMRGIPNELSEAMTVDGAGSMRIYLSMMLPLCKPIILYTMVVTFLGCWNDFMGPLIYLTTRKSYTLALGIYFRFQGELSSFNRPNLQMATGVLMLLPCAVLFFIFQKQLIEGVTMGAIKG